MSPASRCHGCGSGALHEFYRVSDIPVHSCLLMRSREEAVAFPRGELRLVFCSDCGFIQNDAFDAAVQQYSERYEETQSFSSCFNAFSEGLAKRLVDRYALHGRSVLEIGCGKGEFLVSLCELGVGRGIGIDPGYRPERTLSAAAERIEFIRDFYSERYQDLEADLVCCRHTLEHIQPVRAFVDQIRRTLVGRPETVLFFEVPDVLRVLRECAFWDLYYEHCSYFSAGSLARLFRGCGLELLDLSLEYAGQYLLIEARLAEAPVGHRSSLEEDLERLAGEVRCFERRVGAVADAWRSELERHRIAGRRVAIWGAGSKGVAFLTTLGIEDAVACAVDINPHKQGLYMPGSGHRVLGPEDLVRERPEVVLVMNPIYRDEIARDLARLAIEAELIPVEGAPPGTLAA